MGYVDLTKTVEEHQQRKDREKKRVEEKPRKRKRLISVMVLLAAVAVVFFGKDIATLFSPVSVVSNIVRPNLASADGRTNVLVLGMDKRSVGTETSILTDTLLFTSIDNNDGNVAMISLPRDLWVQADAGKGPHYMKINSVYAVDGVEELRAVVEDVTGMPVHYYAVVDFNLFRMAIDTLGGIEINVEHAFVDTEYPIEGKEVETCGRDSEEAQKLIDEGYAYSYIWPCRYQTVSFEAGRQVMDGEAALKFVRSRKGTNGEGTDFARSKRQQAVIMAIKDKVLNLETILNLGKIKELYEAYAENVDTNMNFESINGFWLLSQRIQYDSVRSIVLDDRSAADEGGILYNPADNSLYGGAYVLLPKSGDFSQIRAYVQRYIFGE